MAWCDKKLHPLMELSPTYSLPLDDEFGRWAEA